MHGNRELLPLRELSVGLRIGNTARENTDVVNSFPSGTDNLTYFAAYYTKRTFSYNSHNIKSLWI
jgi:hypothetical protein